MPHQNHVNNCIICKLDKDKQEEIKHLYINWYSPLALARQYKLKNNILWKHAKQFEWDIAKAKNTKMRCIDIASQEPRYYTDSTIMRAVEHLDKLEGNVKSDEDTVLAKLDALTSLELVEQLKRLESLRKSDSIEEPNIKAGKED